MMDNGRMSILYCVDSGQLGRTWLNYSIDSLLRIKMTDSKCRIYVASETPFEREGVTWIDARPYVSLFQLNEIGKIKKEGRTPSPMQIFRIVAPWVKELENTERILYVDIDTEIVSPEIASIYERPMGDIDVYALYEHSKHGNESTQRMLSIKELYEEMSDATRRRLRSGGYFNSGVMIMNLARLRERHRESVTWVRKLVGLAVKHHYKVVDQDILNVVLDAEELNPRANIMPDTDVKIPFGSPIIIHYANSAKYKSSCYPPFAARDRVKPFSNIDFTPPMDTSIDKNIRIPWERYFDKVYCLFFLPHKNRLSRLKSELSRIDLWSSSVFEMRYMVPQKMEEIVLKISRKVQGGCNRLFAVGLGMENIRVMKESLLLGHKRIMIIEDDAAFLMDKKRILDILDSIPDGYGMIQMDKAIREPELRHYQNMISMNRINPFFVDSSSHTFDLSTCNIYNSDGMKKVVEAMEYRMGIIDTIASYIAGEPALSIDNLAVQVIYDDCHTTDFYKRASSFHDFYKFQGIDYNRYGVPQGYSYGSVINEK